MWTFRVWGVRLGSYVGPKGVGKIMGQLPLNNTVKAVLLQLFGFRGRA